MYFFVSFVSHLKSKVLTKYNNRDPVKSLKKFLSCSRLDYLFYVTILMLLSVAVSNFGIHMF